MQVTGEWQSDRPLYNRLTGTVTAVGLSIQGGVDTPTGSVLYFVDERAVVAIPGVHPAYQDIVDGTRGSDVAQLEQFLVDNGYLDAADGKWDARSAKAWGDWRTSQFLPRAKTVLLGEVMFIPDLPRSVAATETLVVGAPIGDNEEVASLLRPLPVLAMELPADASFEVEPGMPVEVDVAGTTVATTASTRRSTTDTGAIRVELDLASTSCSEWCASIATAEPARWRATLLLAAPVEGTLLPVGALRTGDGSATTVMLDDGSLVEVSILAKVGADVVVSGVSPGDVIALPGSIEPAASTTVAP